MPDSISQIIADLPWAEIKYWLLALHGILTAFLFWPSVKRRLFYPSYFSGNWTGFIAPILNKNENGAVTNSHAINDQIRCELVFRYDGNVTTGYLVFQRNYSIGNTPHQINGVDEYQPISQIIGIINKKRTLNLRFRNLFLHRRQETIGIGKVYDFEVCILSRWLYAEIRLTSEPLGKNNTIYVGTLKRSPIK